MALEPSIYEKNRKWYVSCCGKRWGPFSSEGKANGVAALHKMSH